MVKMSTHSVASVCFWSKTERSIAWKREFSPTALASSSLSDWLIVSAFRVGFAQASGVCGWTWSPDPSASCWRENCWCQGVVKLGKWTQSRAELFGDLMAWEQTATFSSKWGPAGRPGGKQGWGDGLSTHFVDYHMTHPVWTKLTCVATQSFSLRASHRSLWHSSHKFRDIVTDGGWTLLTNCCSQSCQSHKLRHGADPVRIVRFNMCCIVWTRFSNRVHKVRCWRWVLDSPVSLEYHLKQEADRLTYRKWCSST